METAIAPELNMEKINREVAGEAPKPKEDKAGMEVASLKHNAGWMEIEEYINGRITELKDFNIEGMNVTDLGYKYALSRGIRHELELIINIIDAHYEQAKGKKEEGSSN